MKDKWMFCKSKVCFFCKRNLEGECDEEVVEFCRIIIDYKEVKQTNGI